MSFTAFANRKGLSTMGRRGFDVHVRLNDGPMNLRSEDEWERLYSQYMTGSGRRA